MTEHWRCSEMKSDQTKVADLISCGLSITPTENVTTGWILIMAIQILGGIAKGWATVHRQNSPCWRGLLKTLSRPLKVARFLRVQSWSPNIYAAVRRQKLFRSIKTQTTIAAFFYLYMAEICNEKRKQNTDWINCREVSIANLSTWHIDYSVETILTKSSPLGACRLSLQSVGRRDTT